MLAAQIPGAIDLTGKTNLRQLVALMERAELVIGNDTGPMHIAAALGRPMVSLFGPTDPDLHRPLRSNRHCRAACDRVQPMPVAQMFPPELLERPSCRFRH